MKVVSPFYTFPGISWWLQVLHAGTVIFDPCEHFEKMTYRNRYRVSGSSNSILLSVPLVNGRNQHIPMSDVMIYNGERWQTQHWRTLVSVYRRTPYFEHYEYQLKSLFETRYDRLVDFNKAGIIWVMKQLKLTFELEEAKAYIKNYPDDIIDLRSAKALKGQDKQIGLPKYYQVFEERIGFQPDLSILDLLFAEGPGSLNLLRS